MNTPTTVNEPRKRSNFQTQYYPRLNGKDSPAPDSIDPNDRIALEFLTVYYDLNCEYARLVEARQGPGGSERGPTVRACLQAIEKVLIARDALEDRHAPLGVIAEPVVRNGFAVDLKLSFGNVNAAGRKRGDFYTIDAFVPIPLPNKASLDDLAIHVEGPGLTPGYD